ncbi:hypothetical protein [Paenibacillus peoriae]|uniref:hypothetical protein n=1 Tax=Paenibacillus peoriae TaxID=59893 RepID=UPI001B7D89F6|nr:hypothetical protein [Paenibacillus peoriae]
MTIPKIRALKKGKNRNREFEIYMPRPSSTLFEAQIHDLFNRFVWQLKSFLQLRQVEEL